MKENRISFVPLSSKPQEKKKNLQISSHAKKLRTSYPKEK